MQKQINLRAQIKEEETKKITTLGAIAAIPLTISGGFSLAATTREAVMHKCNA
jgi:formate-dependent nitrite reductase membrane component NrfD